MGTGDSEGRLHAHWGAGRLESSERRQLEEPYHPSRRGCQLGRLLAPSSQPRYVIVVLQGTNQCSPLNFSFRDFHIRLRYLYQAKLVKVHLCMYMQY